MKRFIFCSMAALLLAACSNSDDATQQSNSSNVAEDATSENTAPDSTSSTAESATNSAATELSTIIDSLSSWSSYQSNTSIVEHYAEGDYPDTEIHLDKQYVADPAQVYMTTSTIGFSNSQLEQYASYEYVDGGFESMDGSEFYDMDTEVVDLLLKDGLAPRAKLLHEALNSATALSNEGAVFKLELDQAKLKDIYTSMQTSFFYNTTANELDAETLEMLSMDLGEFHSGNASITTDGTNITAYSLTFELTSEISGPSTLSFTETFDRVNDFTETDTPEELAIGIGVN